MVLRTSTGVLSSRRISVSRADAQAKASRLVRNVEEEREIEEDKEKPPRLLDDLPKRD